jgi:hypothetical protein
MFVLRFATVTEVPDFKDQEKDAKEAVQKGARRPGPKARHPAGEEKLFHVCAVDRPIGCP